MFLKGGFIFSYGTAPLDRLQRKTPVLAAVGFGLILVAFLALDGLLFFSSAWWDVHVKTTLIGLCGTAYFGVWLLIYAGCAVYSLVRRYDINEQCWAVAILLIFVFLLAERAMSASVNMLGGWPAFFESLKASWQETLRRF